ncbi:type I 3-dehydroquinate dehydratase [Halomicrobium salinisoli]|uniref:type I 3-dehydroquinate dehydratase n=1 Tax=Halomicrobium salinisoli TaxID=2878391 RepID=UPI001CEFDB9E|nr:type I 3-dehydroquinate dehydratase [Halomicrobium salinisoli]
MEFTSFGLLAATTDLSEEPAAREHADGMELRMDLADDPLDALDAYEGELPLLVTNRVHWEGGEAPDDTTRLDALETAVGHDAVEAVDVELAALTGGGDYDATRVVEEARASDVAVVVSTHDFEATPDRGDLVERLRAACEHGDVGKIATTAQSSGDVLDLLDATRTLTDEGERVATMAMGEPGRHSRAVAPLYGSKIGYAPVNPTDATAPGQYDLATLRALIDDLRSEVPERETAAQ